jgi:Cap4 SAVED domain
MSASSPKPSKPPASGSVKTPIAAAGRPLPAHLSGLSKCAETLSTSDGCCIDVWELTVPPTAGYLSEWASKFRQHYCSDAEIDALRAGTGLTRREYLTQLVFPDKSAAPGPGIRAGDFAELLISDYVEHLLGYWVPRGKYAEKASRDESVKGVDILGFRLTNPSVTTPTDTLLTFEVKAQFSGGKYNGRLQTAVDDSSKDYLRRAMTLNATKRRLRQAGEHDKALLVQRFQNLSDHPYIYRSGAAAVLSDTAYDETLLQSATKIAAHQNAANLELIVVRGKELMKLVHALYARAAHEA